MQHWQHHNIIGSITGTIGSITTSQAAQIIPRKIEPGKMEPATDEGRGLRKTEPGRRNWPWTRGAGTLTVLGLGEGTAEMEQGKKAPGFMGCMAKM
jgi:hypothetical protein